MSHHFSSQFYPIFTKQLFLTYSGLCFHFASPKNTRKILISWRFQGMWNESTRQKRVKLKLMTFQRQPLRGVLRKRCSENMQQNYRRTPTPKCDFNKVALKLPCGMGNLLTFLNIWPEMGYKTSTLCLNSYLVDFGKCIYI